jgi:uncharacterized protein YdhG (YjbR/CyaY superfamily)
MAIQSTKKRAARTTPITTVADYIAAAPKDKRAALMKLRKAIKAAAPKATEGISYGMAAFKHNGKPLLHFAYWKNHFALYGMDRTFIDAHAAELKAFDLSKGALRVSADQRLPDRLVTQMVKARIAEIEKAGA